MGRFERMAVSTEWSGTVSVEVSRCLPKSDVARVDPSREAADSRADLLSSKVGQYKRQGIGYHSHEDHILLATCSCLAIASLVSRSEYDRMNIFYFIPRSKYSLLNLYKFKFTNRRIIALDG